MSLLLKQGLPVITNFVDLGLPSGTLWAKQNLGASDPAEAGDFYSFGEPYYKDVFPSRNLTRISDTVYYSGGLNPVNYGPIPTQCESWRLPEKTIEEWEQLGKTGSTEIEEKGIINSDGSLNNDFDAAYVVTNGEATMPTKEQITELYRNTDITVSETDNNVKVIKFTNRTDSTKFIIIPCAGSKNGAESYSDGSAKNDHTIGFGLIAKDSYREDDGGGRIDIGIGRFTVNGDTIIYENADFTRFGFATIGLPIRPVKQGQS